MAREIGEGNVLTDGGYVRWAPGTLYLGESTGYDRQPIYECPRCKAVIRTERISFDAPWNCRD
jgi:hypothetical protein